MNRRLALGAALFLALISSAKVAFAAGTPTTTAVMCQPDNIAQNAQSTCTVTVTGSGPTGTVEWSQTSNDGAVVHFVYPLSGQTCQLSGGTCYVKVVGQAPGTVKILALFRGDTNNQASQGSTNLVVNSTIAATNSSQTTTFATTFGGSSASSGGAAGLPLAYIAPIAVIAIIVILALVVRSRRK